MNDLKNKISTLKRSNFIKSKNDHYHSMLGDGLIKIIELEKYPITNVNRVISLLVSQKIDNDIFRIKPSLIINVKELLKNLDILKIPISEHMSNCKTVDKLFGHVFDFDQEYSGYLRMNANSFVENLDKFNLETAFVLNLEKNRFLYWRHSLNGKKIIVYLGKLLNNEIEIVY
ncbi:hypothetical protein [Ekhidna sp.]